MAAGMLERSEMEQNLDLAAGAWSWSTESWIQKTGYDWNIAKEMENSRDSDGWGAAHLEIHL